MGLVAALFAIFFVTQLHTEPREAVKWGVFTALIGMVPLFMRLMRGQRLSELELKPFEKVIKHGAATLAGIWPGRYGWLYLTEVRLYFKPGILNLNRKPVEIPLSSVTKIAFTPKNFINNQEMELSTSSGKMYRFTVAVRINWPEGIQEALG